MDYRDSIKSDRGDALDSTMELKVKDFKMFNELEAENQGLCNG